jgi:AcrR family transcriptional regulator
MFMKAAAKRRARHRDEMRLEILSAARHIFVRYGVENFSMRTLARAVGYSPAAIYLHFTNKEQLLEVLVEESFAHLYDALQVLLHKNPTDPIRQLKRGLRLYVEWGLKNPSEYQIAFVVRNPAKNPYRTHRAFDLARTLVKRCLGSSKAAERELELRTQALWAATHGITSLLTQRPSFPWVSRESVINQVIDSAVQGAIGPAKRRKAKRKN